MPDPAFDPILDTAERQVTTQWYCAFGSRPLVQVIASAEGVAEAVRLEANLDAVDGIVETRFRLADAVPPPASTYHRVAERAVPSTHALRAYCTGIICVLTALWTEALTLEQLERAAHPDLDFYRHAMKVLGCDNPLGRAVSGRADPPDPRYAWT
jgi:hypothetical protein